jgi:aspartate aminotransferase-like enzyme
MRQRYNVLIAAGQGPYIEKVLRITTIGAIGERDLIGTMGLLEMVLAKKGFLKAPGHGVTAMMDHFLQHER